MQNLISIVVHVVSRVLRVSLGLVEVRVFIERWPRHSRLKKKEKKSSNEITNVIFDIGYINKRQLAAMSRGILPY
jgi:hypothetical protein